MTCTEVSARWCPLCGDCCCPTNSGGEPVDWEELRWRGDPDQCALAMNGEECPLHSSTSHHGEFDDGITTIWGKVAGPELAP